MARIKGREVQVEISKTEGSGKTISAITKAAPPEVSSTAHGFNNGQIGYFSGMTGMTTLEGQAFSVADKATDAFDAEDLSTVGLPDFSAGSAIPISAWASFGEITNFEVTGGEGIEQDETTLHDVINQVAYAGLSPQVLNFQSLLDLPNNEAMTLLRTAARTQSYVLFRITMKNGARIVARAMPSLPSLSLARSETGTRAFTATVKGQVLELPAVAS